MTISPLDEDAVSGRPRISLVVPFIIGVAFLMEQLDATVITASLPAMAESLAVKPLQMHLAITSYILSLAVFIPVSGWVADRFGARRVFLGAIVVFTVGSILCGAANSLPTLVAARVFTGLGGAMMTPIGRLILLRSFSRAELVGAMSYMSIPVLLGPLLGPLLGGLITTYASWRWIFFLNVPIGIVGFALALRFIPADGLAGAPRPFDIRGFLFVGLGLALSQMVIEDFVHPILSSWALAGIIVLALALFLAYGRHARICRSPVLDVSLFRIRVFRIGSLWGGAARVGLNAVPFLLQLQLQLGFGYSPIHASLLVFVSALGSLVMKPVLTRLLRRVGFKSVLVFDSLASAALVAGFSLLTPQTPAAFVIGYVFLYGISRTVMFNTVQTLTFAEVPAERLSAAVGLAGVVQQLTMGFGVSLSAAAISLVAGHVAVPSAADFARIFLLMALVPLVSLLGFLGLRAKDGHEASGHRGARSELARA